MRKETDVFFSPLVEEYQWQNKQSVSTASHLQWSRMKQYAMTRRNDDFELGFFYFRRNRRDNYQCG